MKHTYAPFIANEQVGAIGPQSDEVAAFEAAWMLALGPRANLMRPDSRLYVCAHEHAVYLASRTGEAVYVSMHVGAGGSYSNDRVLDAGYHLPREYKRGVNNVESCAHDGRTPAEVLQGTEEMGGLLDSPSHRAHMLGEPGFMDRLVYGVGMAGEYWVVLACPLESWG